MFNYVQLRYYVDAVRSSAWWLQLRYLQDTFCHIYIIIFDRLRCTRLYIYKFLQRFNSIASYIKLYLTRACPATNVPNSSSTWERIQFHKPLLSKINILMFTTTSKKKPVKFEVLRVDGIIFNMFYVYSYILFGIKIYSTTFISRSKKYYFIHFTRRFIKIYILINNYILSLKLRFE